MMKKRALSLMLYFLTITMPNCKGGEPGISVTITGDSTSIGAVIYSGEKKIGVIDEKVYKGDSNYSNSGERYGSSRIKLPKGSSVLKIVDTNNAELKKEIHLTSEGYFQVDFQKGIIRGE